MQTYFLHRKTEIITTPSDFGQCPNLIENYGSKGSVTSLS